MMFRRSITLIAAGVMLAGMLAGAGSAAAAAAEATTKEQAQEIALNDAGLSEDDVTWGDIEKGSEQTVSVYEIEFWTDSKEYEYDIALADGEIVSAGWELTDPYPEGKKISESAAKDIALKHAGVNGNKASFTKSRSGTENGIPVYEFDFNDDSKEYEYDIAKEGGEILSYSMKVKKPGNR